MNFTINTNAFSTALSQIFGCTPKTAKNIKTGWGNVIIRANGSALLVEVDTDSVWLRTTLQATASVIEEGSVSVNTLDLLHALYGLEEEDTLSVTTVAATDTNPTALALHATEKIFVTLPAKIESQIPQAEIVEFQVGRTDFINCARVSSCTRFPDVMQSIYVGRNSLFAVCEVYGIVFIWQKQGVKVSKTTNPVCLTFRRSEARGLINALLMNPSQTLKCERRKGVKDRLAIDAGCTRLLLTLPRKHEEQPISQLASISQPRPYRFVVRIAELLSAFRIIKRVTKDRPAATTRFQFDRTAKILHLETVGHSTASLIVNILDSFMPSDSTGFLQVSFVAHRLIDAFRCPVSGALAQLDFTNDEDSMRVAFDAQDRACEEVWTRNDELLTRERLVMFCAIKKLTTSNPKPTDISSGASSDDAPQSGELSHV